jgi:hypothetical protein
MSEHRKPEGQQKHVYLKVRVTKSQMKAYKEAAEKDYLDLSSWARRTLMKEAERLNRDS